MLNQLNVSHGKMSDFVSFSLFGFTLVIKLRNRNFSVLWLKWTQIMEMKKNQIFFHETHSDLASFFICCKILKCLNDFYNWHVSISLHKWAQISKAKWNKAGYVQIWQYFPLFTTPYTIKWLFKFASWYGLSQKWMLTVPK